MTTATRVDLHREPRAVGDWIDHGDGTWSVWDGEQAVFLGPETCCVAKLRDAACDFPACWEA